MTRRDERREYEGDVWYDVWRRGGNPDLVHPDRIDDHYWNGHSAEQAASIELERQRPKPTYEEYQYDEQQYEQEQESAADANGDGRADAADIQPATDAAGRQ